MSIAPIDIPLPANEPRRPFPIEGPPSGPIDPEPPDSIEPTDGGESARGPREPSLAQLIAQLSKQLRSIEKTFISALQSLARETEQAAQGAQPGGRAVQPAGGAAFAPGAAGTCRAWGASGASGANPYDGLIRRAAQSHELDPALLRAVIRAESGFDARACSPAGAMGLMQLMPDTAKSLGVADPYDPRQNVEGGARLLRGLIDRYAGRLDLALAAYNAGPGAVAKYGGVPPYKETREYVRSILADYKAGALGA